MRVFCPAWWRMSMFYNFKSEFAGFSCNYCFEKNELGQVSMFVRKAENEQLMFDFSRKLNNLPELAVLPDTVMVFEDNSRFTDEVFLRLRNAKVVKPWIKKANLQGVAVAICGLTEEFVSMRDGLNTMAVAGKACA